MNQFTVRSPEAGFNGESLGVHFKDGVGHVNDSSKEGRAAIEYFRRRGYTLEPEGSGQEQADGPQEKPAEPTEPSEPFDPAKHSAEEVLTYLDSTTDEDEIARVLDAEQAGKARKTILQKGTDQ